LILNQAIFGPLSPAALFFIFPALFPDSKLWESQRKIAMKCAGDAGRRIHHDP